MTTLTTLTQIHILEERYPFNAEELEILVRCHTRLEERKEGSDDFLMQLALTSPYSFFFLPGEAMRDHVDWIENHVLPAGFANALRAAMSVDAFVNYANQGLEKPLERFIEGVADTGRRGAKEALRTLYNIVGDDPSPEVLVDLSIRLLVASEALVTPNLDKEAIMSRLDGYQPAVQSMAQSLNDACHGKSVVRSILIDWVEANFPMLATPLSMFVHNLLFHGHPYPETRIPYSSPRLDQVSDVFPSSESPLLMTLSLTSPSFSGKWHNLYSSEFHGRSFNRLEWSLLGYSGPTIMMVRTTEDATLGAFAAAPWKDARHFYGNSECFLFQLDPQLKMYRRSAISEENFMFMHSDAFHSPVEPKNHDFPHGIGFGGTLAKPRLFVPASLEECSADFFDKTFESGELLPVSEREKFEIGYLEIWGVGGSETIEQGLRDRTEYRERADAALIRARVVSDRSAFVKDLKSGLIPNRVFAHDEQVRGREDFLADNEHGGYKIDRS